MKATIELTDLTYNTLAHMRDDLACKVANEAKNGQSVAKTCGLLKKVNEAMEQINNDDEMEWDLA